jgi:hypothetical protein
MPLRSLQKPTFNYHQPHFILSKIVSQSIFRRKMLQYSEFKLPHGNAAFGEHRLPEITPLGQLETIR